MILIDHQIICFPSHHGPKEVLVKIPAPVRLRQRGGPVQGGDDLIQYGGEVFALDFIDAPAGFEFGDSVLQLFLNLLHIDYIL